MGASGIFSVKTSEEARLRKQQNIYFYNFDTNMIHLIDRDLIHLQEADTHTIHFQYTSDAIVFAIHSCALVCCCVIVGSEVRSS